MELLSHLVFFVFGYWLASQVIAFTMRNAIKRIAKENGITLEQEENPTTVSKIPVMTTELVDNGILLYDTKNNFMCQGKSLDEIADNLLKFKKVKVAMVVHNNNKFWCVEGKIKRI